MNTFSFVCRYWRQAPFYLCFTWFLRFNFFTFLMLNFVESFFLFILPWFGSCFWRKTPHVMLLFCGTFNVISGETEIKDHFLFPSTFFSQYKSRQKNRLLRKDWNTNLRKIFSSNWSFHEQILACDATTNDASGFDAQGRVSISPLPLLLTSSLRHLTGPLVGRVHHPDVTCISSGVLPLPENTYTLVEVTGRRQRHVVWQEAFDLFSIHTNNSGTQSHFFVNFQQ